MKKRTGIRMTILVLVLAVAMIMGTMSLTAFADTTKVTGDSTVKFFDQFYYNEPVTLDANAKVTAPNGEEFTGTFTPMQIGAYTVSYGTDNKYSYTVPCTIKKDYQLRVENDGADIPTYMVKNGEFTLPTASVWFASEKYGVDYEQETETDPDTSKKNYVLKYKIIGLDTTEKDIPATAEGRKIKIENAGSYTVRYICKIGGADGTKYLTKDYDVKVQDGFDDAEAPGLNVVNIPREISLNTKVTLPKVTATDNYDKNVKVGVTVSYYDSTNGWQPVPHATPNKYGYADEDTVTDQAEVFDNINHLTFYPTKAGKYKVEFSAFDDAGNKTTGTHVYNCEAVDKTAPVLKEIDDDKIPTKWGAKVTRAKQGTVAEGESKTEDVDTKITFPYPTYVDNNSKQLTVSFKITDTVNNNTVISFSNIYDESEEGSGRKYTYDANKASNGLHPNNEEFTDKGFEFDFKDYFDKMTDAQKTYTGTYTVQYQARDTHPNISTKTYDITFEEAFTDTEKPDPKVTFDDDYLLFTNTEKEFVIPSAKVSDNVDTRPTVEYRLVNGEVAVADLTDANSIKVDGGETAKIQIKEGNATLTVENKADPSKTKTLTLNDATNKVLKYVIIATDDAGNQAILESSVDADASYKSIKVLKATDFTTVPTLDATGLTETSGTAGEEVTVGGFSFEVDKDSRDFYGFEMSLTQDNKVLNAPVSFRTYFKNHDTDEAKGIVHVKNIKFVAPKAGDVYLNIRLFNVAGMSRVESHKIAVSGGTPGDGGFTSGINVPVSGTVRTSYVLKNRVVNYKPEGFLADSYLVRDITAVGKFSLMRDTFTAYNSGKFEFSDGYFKGDENTVATLTNGNYTLTVTDKATPVWQIQGDMPTYTDVAKNTFATPTAETDKNNLVKLPKVIASSDYANAKVVLTVTDNTGAPLKVEGLDDKKNEISNADKDVRINETTGQYEFYATKDGSYTLTYSAYYGDSGEKITQTFTIKAGDNVAPTFKLKNVHGKNALEGDTFTFSALEVTSAADTTTTAQSNTKYNKRLKDPAGTVVYEVSGSGNTKRDATKPTDGSTYSFSKIGTYTVEYTVTDKAGNESIKTYTISVSAKKVNNPISTKIISTILIIVGVLLIAGVILYFIRFRKVKSK